MKPEVTYGEFAKLDLRVATILEAVPVEGSLRLLTLKLGIGRQCDPDRVEGEEVFECSRQIVAGIGGEYSVESLVGKQIVVVLNLEPKVIRGVESNGMLLAADVDGKPILLSLDRPVPDGSVVR